MYRDDFVEVPIDSKSLVESRSFANPIGIKVDLVNGDSVDAPILKVQSDTLLGLHAKIEKYCAELIDAVIENHRMCDLANLRLFIVSNDGVVVSRNSDGYSMTVGMFHSQADILKVHHAA